MKRISAMNDFTWPDGASAAVSITYDDAAPTQRRAAAELSRHGLRGTFFLMGKSDDLAQHRGAWRALLADGHELASHTIHHPCDCKHDWVPRGYTTQDYDLPRMAKELDQTLELLNGLGAPAPYTFAYPCGETLIGKPPVSYQPLVDERFFAVRGVESRIADPASVDLAMIPAFDGAKPIQELVELIDRTVAEHGWLVLLFHGVGGDHLPVDGATHTALLELLAQRRGAVWTDTFGAVASHVRAQRAPGP
jgi:peptidoglycan/xylan/chitin deacetylase (PgdA/CDA1 family)